MFTNRKPATFRARTSLGILVLALASPPYYNAHQFPCRQSAIAMGQAYDFSRYLAQFGPDAHAQTSLSLAQADALCLEIAKGHAENFPVLSFALPKHLRPDFARVYAFCRWADDLGDEVGSTDQSLVLLDWWQDEVHALFDRHPRHPIMRALAPTVARYNLPQQPFLDLIAAFRQDQTKTRYDSWEELLEYCTRSADPVGRIVLHLFESFTPETARLSDQICTGLQLANFWQDVRVDYFDKGRVYLPSDLRAQHNVTENTIASAQTTPEFLRLMQDVVARADASLVAGLQLRHHLPGRFAYLVSLFGEGGRAILRRIRQDGYNVLAARPKLSRGEKAGLFVTALLGLWKPNAKPRPTATPKRSAGITE